MTEFGRTWGLVTELLSGPARFAGSVRRKESECRLRYQQISEIANAKGKDAGGPEAILMSMNRNQARQFLGRCLPIGHEVLRTHIMSLRKVCGLKRQSCLLLFKKLSCHSLLSDSSVKDYDVLILIVEL